MILRRCDDDDADKTAKLRERVCMLYGFGYDLGTGKRYSILIEYPLLYYQCMRRN